MLFTGPSGEELGSAFTWSSDGSLTQAGCKGGRTPSYPLTGWEVIMEDHNSKGVNPDGFREGFEEQEARDAIRTQMQMAAALEQEA